MTTRIEVTNNVLNAVFVVEDFMDFAELKDVNPKFVNDCLNDHKDSELSAAQLEIHTVLHFFANMVSGPCENMPSDKLVVASGWADEHGISITALADNDSELESIDINIETV